MSLYSTHTRKSKIILIVLGMGILAFTIGYSVKLANAFRDMEEKRAILQTKASTANELQDVPAEVSDLIFFIQDSMAVPVIVENDAGELSGFNFTEEKADSSFLAKKKQEFLNTGSTPIAGRDYYRYIYYLESPNLAYIRFFPFILSVLVGFYILLSYMMFNAYRKSEESKVWAGMAKETAHQLGTPLSALMFGLENMKESIDHPDELRATIQSMERYVEKLELVADRFSKIGSVPVLEASSLYDVVADVKQYMQETAPSKVTFELKPPAQDYLVNINKHLFSWVIENLINNSLNALEGKGTIAFAFQSVGNTVHVLVTDTGHGMSPGQFKKVFEPGYSTKKRGWGLGLSLAKRIVEEYHKGKIWVKESVPHERTTFVISLPLQSA